MTFASEKLPPPPKTQDWREQYRWNYLLFEYINGIRKLLASGIENTPVGSITATDVQGTIAQLDSIFATDVDIAARFHLTTGHDHDGADSKAVDHVNLASKGTNTHAQVDTHLAAASPHSGHEVTTAKDAISGYAGLNAVSRTTKGVDTTDDIIFNLATKGPVLKDTQGTPHYWRVTVTTLGVLVTTDLGTVKP